MALYLGSNKVKVNMNEIQYSIHAVSTPINFEGVRLLTSDGFILKDKNGIYITAKEDE